MRKGIVPNNRWRVLAWGAVPSLGVLVNQVEMLFGIFPLERW